MDPGLRRGDESFALEVKQTCVANQQQKAEAKTTAAERKAKAQAKVAKADAEEDRKSVV